MSFREWQASYMDRIPYRDLLLNLLQQANSKRINGDIVGYVEGLRAVYDSLFFDLREEVKRELEEKEVQLLEKSNIAAEFNIQGDILTRRRLLESAAEFEAFNVSRKIQRIIMDVLYRHGLLVWREEEIEEETI